MQNLFYFRKDLNEFFEYCTEWEPTNSLYFGDNILQDVLAPKRFTSTIDSVVVSEEMLAEGIHGKEELSHPDKGPILDLKIHLKLNSVSAVFLQCSKFSFRAENVHFIKLTFVKCPSVACLHSRGRAILVPHPVALKKN